MGMISETMSKGDLSREKIDEMADRLAEELSKNMYYEFILFKNIPEVKAIKSGSVKALKNDEARAFLKKA